MEKQKERYITTDRLLPLLKEIINLFKTDSNSMEHLINKFEELQDRWDVNTDIDNEYVEILLFFRDNRDKCIVTNETYSEIRSKITDGRRLKSQKDKHDLLFEYLLKIQKKKHRQEIL